MLISSEAAASRAGGNNNKSRQIETGQKSLKCNSKEEELVTGIEKSWQQGKANWISSDRKKREGEKERKQINPGREAGNRKQQNEKIIS